MLTERWIKWLRDQTSSLFFVSYCFTWVGTGQQKAYIGSGNIISYKISYNTTSGYGIQESACKDGTNMSPLSGQDFAMATERFITGKLRKLPQ